MRVVLSSASSVALYEQIETQIRNAINGGELVAGVPLPSLRQLAAELRVSVITVTRAYNDLVAQGLVRNEHGRGFIVCAVDADRARHALVARVDAATEELVSAGRGARMTIDEIRQKVENAWNRQ